MGLARRWSRCSSPADELLPSPPPPAWCRIPEAGFQYPSVAFADALVDAGIGGLLSRGRTMEFLHSYGELLSASTQFDVVEVKGVGHPDSVCDAISATASALYSKYTLERYGRVPNHFIDNVTVVGGSSAISFGTARLLSPVRVYFHGGISDRFGDEQIAVEAILSDAARRVFRERAPRLRFDDHVQLIYALADVADVHTRGVYWYQPRSQGDVPTPSNATAVDTSCVTAYWPLSPTEHLVQGLDSYLASSEFLNEMECIGTDTKILAVRRGQQIDVTVNVPVLAGDVQSQDDYDCVVAKVHRRLEGMSAQLTEGHDLHLDVNPGNAYMAVYSGAMELRDVGSTGRGNAYNGLISSYRAHSMECAFGKSPSNYGGIVYAEASQMIARQLCETLGTDIQVSIVSKLGDPMSQPSYVMLQGCKGYDESRAERLVCSILADPDVISERVIARWTS